MSSLETAVREGSYETKFTWPADPDSCFAAFEQQDSGGMCLRHLLLGVPEHLDAGDSLDLARFGMGTRQSLLPHQSIRGFDCHDDVPGEEPSTTCTDDGGFRRARCFYTYCRCFHRVRLDLLLYERSYVGLHEGELASIPAPTRNDYLG